MRVYLESNFVLELVLEQAEHAACEAIVALAEAKRVELALPAVALVEAHFKLERSSRQRKALLETLRPEMRQIGRTKSFADAEAALSSAIALIVRSAEDARSRHEVTVARLVGSSRVLPLDAATLSNAAVVQASYRLEWLDALVLASVFGDLDPARPACFVNRDRDFFDATIVADLNARSCKLIGRFDHGLGYVGSQLGPGP